GGKIELIRCYTNYNIISRNEIILNETIEFMPVFSSDGNFLFFCQKDKKSISVTETKIKKINLKNFSETEILTDSNIISICVSNDNKSIFYITKSDSYSINTKLIDTGEIKKIYDSDCKLNYLITTDIKKSLYFTEYDDNSKTNILYRVVDVNSLKKQIVQCSVSDIDIIDPSIINGNLYYISYKSGHKTRRSSRDVFLLKGTESLKSEIISEYSVEYILNLLNLAEGAIDENLKKYIIKKYLELKFDKLDSNDKYKLIDGLMDYYLFLKKYRDLSLLSNYYADENLNFIIKLVSEYYMKLENKSNFEKKRMKTFYENSLKNLFKNSKNERIRNKSTELLADLTSENDNLTDAVILYDTIFFNIKNDTPVSARLLYKKAEIYRNIGQENSYIAIMTELLKKYDYSNLITDKALNNVVQYYSDEKKNTAKISIINYLTELADKSRGISKLSSKFLFKASELAYLSNENHLAKKILTDVIKNYPESFMEISEANIKIGDILFSEENYEKSLQYYKAAVDNDSKLSEKKYKSEEKFKQKMFDKGIYEERTGDYEKAFKTFYRLIEFDTAYVRAHRELIKLGNMLGRTEEIEKIYDNFLKTRVAVDEEAAAINYAVSLLLTYKKDWKKNLERSEKMVLESIRLKPRISYYYQLLGWINEQLELVLNKHGRFEYSIDYYKTAFALTEDENYRTKTELLTNIGNVYYHIKNYEMAYRYYNRRIEMYDNFFEEDKNRQIVFFINYAYSAFIMNDYQNAEFYYIKVLNMSPDNETARMCMEKLSLIYYSAGKYSNAMEILNRAAEFEAENMSPQKKYYNKRSVLLFMMNYLTDPGSFINEIEKLKMKNQASILINEAEKYYSESFSSVLSKKEALINIKFNLTRQSDQSSDARSEEGLDYLTEQKFLYMLANEFYKLYGNEDKSLETLFKRLECIPENITPENSPGLYLEKAILYNNISKIYFLKNNTDSAVFYAESAIKLSGIIKDDNGIYINLILMASYLENMNSREKEKLIYKMEKYYELVSKKNIYFDFPVLSAFAFFYFQEFTYSVPEIEKVLNNIFSAEKFDTGNIRLFNEYVKLDENKKNAVKYLKNLKEAFSEIKVQDKMILLLNEINDLNIKTVESNFSDSNILSSESAITWLNFYYTSEIEKLKNYEQNLTGFLKEVSYIQNNGYRFVNEKILFDLYNKIINFFLKKQDCIQALVYIDRYLNCLNYVLKHNENLFFKIAGEEDIYYFQSLIGEEKKFNILYNTGMEEYLITADQNGMKCGNYITENDNLDVLDNIGGGAYLILVNYKSDDIFRFGKNRILVPSITGFIKAKENQTIFNERIKLINNENINNFVNDKDYDILIIDADLEMNSKDISKSKIADFKTGFNTGINFFRDAGVINVNYLILRKLRCGDINSSVFNCILLSLIESGISNIVFNNEPDYSLEKFNYRDLTIPGNKKIYVYGSGNFSDTEKIELAKTKTDELIQTAAEEFEKKNYTQSLSNMERVISMNKVVLYENELIKKYLKFAVKCAFNSENYNKSAFYQNEYIRVSNLSPTDFSRELYNLGIFYSMNEEYDSAAYCFNEALKYNTQDSKFIISAKTELAKTNEFKGEYINAVSYIENIISATDKIEILGEQYSRLGKIYYLRLNDYIKSEEYFRKSLEYYEEKKDYEKVSRTLIDIGLVLEQLGKFNESRDMYGKALNIVNEKKITYMIPEIYQNFGNTFWYEGDYKQAFDYSFKSADMAKKNEDEQQLYISYNTLGLIYWTLNNYDKAIYYFNLSVSISKKLKKYNDVSSTLNNMAIVLNSQKKYADSIEYLNQAIEIDRKLKSRWALGYDYRNLGIAYLALNDFQKAKDCLESAYSISSEINNHINKVKCALELGNLFFKIENYEVSQDWYNKSFESSKKIGIKEVEWRSIYGKALCIEKIDKKKSILFLSEAIDIIEKMRSNMKIEELKNGFVTDKKNVYDKIISLYIETGDFVKAFEYLERFKSRSLIDLLGNHKIRFNNKEIDKLYAKIISNKIFIDNYNKQINYEPAEWKKNIIKEQISKLEIENSESLLKMKLINPEIESVINVNVLTYSELKNYIDTETVFLEYYSDTNFIYIWIISKEKFDFVETKLPINFDVKNSVTDFIIRIQNKAYIEESAEKLYSVLFEPAVKYISDKKYICIIPFDSLHYLP
ncbi:tetratricopeptide repeat protein, partial [Candidatus Dependentiae bacterium]|nr:tetratricopeptide repeat protein [Candidatus Dependentiae bacterium]